MVLNDFTTTAPAGTEPPESTSQRQLQATPFGKPMRALFNFAPTHHPLNHGSYGTIPTHILQHRQQLQRDVEARPSIYNRYVYPPLLVASRAAVAPLLGCPADEVVLVANATTGVNTILRALRWNPADVVLCFRTVYPACLKTVQALAEVSPDGATPSPWVVPLTYPIEDAALIALFEQAVDAARAAGKTVRLALFDAVTSHPGVRVPWEALVQACRARGILSLVDAAHGVGCIDMRHVGDTSPDFLVSNLHKWLFVPRGCAVLYVPRRNQALVASCLPTSHGYATPERRAGVAVGEYFAGLFVDVATTDKSPYCCVGEALQFREEVCGGEERIREYCFRLAREGGDRAAEVMGTEVLRNESGSTQECVFANVRLPLAFYEDGEGEDGKGDIALSHAQAVFDWIFDQAANEFDTYFQLKFSNMAFWVRLSAQIYLDVEDFEWGARTLVELCERAKRGEWKNAGELPRGNMY